MSVRLFSALVLAGWLLCGPLINGADRKPQATPSPLEARQDAVRQAKDRIQARHLAFDVVKQRYEAKRRALDGLLDAAKSRQQKISALAAIARQKQDQINNEKARTLVEERLIAKIIRERDAAEELAIAAVIRSLESENPNFRDNAIRVAKRQAEQAEAGMVTELLDLPVLNNALPMTYYQGGVPTDNLVAKIMPTEIFTPPITIRPDKETLERSIKQRMSLRKVADIARQQQALKAEQAHQNRESKLKELIDLYKKDKISAAEYYRRKEILLNGTGQ
ncbi:MAG: hypothetical protein CMO74_05580 [Verrucomicrobiales bacterium]|nr:hypothetical protein [Verrucomicrobiales bacterium]|tara:strand:+ start:650 stop:1483 length:834 start_codon:yes stop_codon:yes gene_type:complete